MFVLTSRDFIKYLQYPKSDATDVRCNMSNSLIQIRIISMIKQISSTGSHNRIIHLQIFHELHNKHITKFVKMIHIL